MNAVGIDVSKNKSMVAVACPFGQVVVKPFEVRHTAIELKKLADFLKSLDKAANPEGLQAALRPQHLKLEFEMLRH